MRSYTTKKREPTMSQVWKADSPADLEKDKKVKGKGSNAMNFIRMAQQAAGSMRKRKPINQRKRY